MIEYVNNHSEQDETKKRKEPWMVDEAVHFSDIRMIAFGSRDNGVLLFR